MDLDQIIINDNNSVNNIINDGQSDIINEIDN